MFAVKICGITAVQDARIAEAAGADAVGLNFHPPSPRAISPARAHLIAAALPATVAKIGVFVNAPAEHVRQIVSAVGLDAVQLHGDEPPETLDLLRSVPVVRAFRVSGPAEMPAVTQYLHRCRQLNCLPSAVLLDTWQSGQFGGTGRTVDWQSLADSMGLLAGIPLVLAGGLTADNVALAVQALRPDAVDTASGVEKRPGEKDEMLVRRFVAAARAALHAAHSARFADS